MTITEIGAGWTRAHGYPKKIPEKLLHKEWWGSDGKQRLVMRKRVKRWPQLPDIILPQK